MPCFKTLPALLALLLCATTVFARPNILLVMTDDQGYGDASFTGHPVLQTPGIDRLAEEGVWMQRFYVSPVCTPTRAALMTGRWNQRTGAVDTYIGRAVMRSDEVTIAERLRDAGYATGIFGKWHLGDGYPTRAMDQGFTRSLVHTGGGLRQPANEPDGDRYHNPILMDEGEPRRFEGYCTDIFFDAAKQFIDESRAAGKPFFTYLATNAPHGPWDEPPTGGAEKFRDAAPDERSAVNMAMIDNIDQNLVRMLDHLDATGLSANTIVIFLSDNGPAVPGWNAHLRGRKASVHEGGIRTLMVARWPGRFSAGFRTDTIAAHIDLFPTLLSAAGVPIGNGPALDGRNILPLLEGRSVAWPDRTLHLQWHRGNTPQARHSAAVVTQRWKLSLASNPGLNRIDTLPEPQLFDLLHDPSEEHDMADRYPAIVAELLAKHDAWHTDVSSSHADNYAVVPFTVGSKQRRVSFTRQDIRSDAPDAQGWWVTGYWAMDVEQAGSYRLTARLREPAQGPTRVTVWAAGKGAEATIPAGKQTHTFTLSAVPAGSTRLLATSDANGNPIERVVVEPASGG